MKKFKINFILLILISIISLLLLVHKLEPDKSILIDITKEDFIYKVENNEEFYVYIGRPSCHECKKFTPRLEKLLKKFDKTLFYYNIEGVNNKEEIMQYLSKFNVKTIPSIIHIKEGKVITIYNCEEKLEVEKFINKFELLRP